MHIVIASLIGVGKTTLAENLASLLPNSIAFYEPVDGNPYLSKYYAEPETYAFPMQCFLLGHRFKNHQLAHWQSIINGHDCIVDRSIYEDYEFALVQKEDGFMDDLNFSTYEQLHEIMQNFVIFPDIILLLELPIDKLMERINERARDCESGISREYMEHLKSAYDRLIPTLEKKCPVVHIDASKTKNQVLLDAMDAIAERRKQIDCHPRYKGGF